MRRNVALLLAVGVIGLAAFAAGCEDNNGVDVAPTPAPGQADEAAFVNTHCPIMGSRISGDVPPHLTREHQDGKVAFCCAGCPEQWDRMSDAQRAAALAEAAPTD